MIFQFHSFLLIVKVKMAAIEAFAAFSTVGLEQHAKDPVHLVGRDAMDSEEGNFVVKCRHAAL